MLIMYGDTDKLVQTYLHTIHNINSALAIVDA